MKTRFNSKIVEKIWLKIANIISLNSYLLKDDIKYNLLKDHGRGIFVSLIGNLINIIGLLYIFYNQIGPTYILVGIISISAILLRRVYLGKIIRSLSVTNIAAVQNIWDRVCYNSIFYGIWWASTLFFIMQIAQSTQQLIVIAAGAGMMSGCTIAYRTIAPAAKITLTLMSIGCLAALLSLNSAVADATALLLGSYYLVLLRHIIGTSSDIITRLKREHELKVSADTINMLLTDFTEQGSDWLLEFNESGHLINPCNRMAEACLRPIETLDDSNIFDIFDKDEQSKDLKNHISLGHSVNKHIISLTIDNEQHWWSISARVSKYQNANDSNSSESRFLYRGVVSDITAHRQAEEKVNHMAHFDALTDLPNRFQFNQNLNIAMQSNTTKLGLMYLDLDNFKAINDTLGHPIGDKLLQSVSKRLQACLQNQDIVARLGGDEFAIIIQNSSEKICKSIAERIISVLSTPFQIDGHDIIIGCSIGLAIAPEDGITPEILLRNSDLALYSAKSNGRNRSVRYIAGMDESAHNRRMLEMDMRVALANNEMILHYQPIVDLIKEETIGYEALIRWNNPERGTVMPDQFIPVAEETGLIVQLGEWAIRKAIDDMRQWPDGFHLSINLSPAQMRSPSLIATIVNMLANTDISADRICLEITEAALMQDSEANLATLHKLRELGLKIALDDFGTGYSSLNYLRSFPLDKIKIDRCFVDEIDSSKDCQAIIKSIVDLANTLGIVTAAEGVERDEQIQYLRDKGCVEAQGYLYSKAVPQNQLSNLTQRSDIEVDTLVDLEVKRHNKETAKKGKRKKPDSSSKNATHKKVKQKSAKG